MFIYLLKNGLGFFFIVSFISYCRYLLVYLLFLEYIILKVVNWNVQGVYRVIVVERGYSWSLKVIYKYENLVKVEQGQLMYRVGSFLC